MRIAMFGDTKPGPDTVYYRTGSPEQVADLIAAQDRARAASQGATATKSYAPWVIGGLIVAGAAWWLTRD